MSMWSSADGQQEPNWHRIAREAQAAGVRPIAPGEPRIALLCIDMQQSFCRLLPDRPRSDQLYVDGAEGDVRRTADWIYRRGDRISRIIVTLDTHSAFQIFSPFWWIDPDGRFAEPYTVISADDVRAGRWRPNPEVAGPYVEWSAHYVERLAASDKQALVIWPIHCLTGSAGHALDPALNEAVFWHEVHRQSPRWTVIKSESPASEFYSPVEPEVHDPLNPAGQVNHALLDGLDRFDSIYVAGEASTHCVKEFFESVLRHRPGLMGKLVLLGDCTSPVRHPSIDFEAASRARYDAFRAAGLRTQLSTDPL